MDEHVVVVSYRSVTELAFPSTAGATDVSTQHVTNLSRCYRTVVLLAFDALIGFVLRRPSEVLVGLATLGDHILWGHAEDFCDLHHLIHFTNSIEHRVACMQLVKNAS